MINCGIQCPHKNLLPYMPTLKRLKAVGGGLGEGEVCPPLKNCFSEGRKMVHSAAFWI